MTALALPPFKAELIYPHTTTFDATPRVPMSLTFGSIVVPPTLEAGFVSGSGWWTLDDSHWGFIRRADDRTYQSSRLGALPPLTTVTFHFTSSTSDILYTVVKKLGVIK